VNLQKPILNCASWASSGLVIDSRAKSFEAQMTFSAASYKLIFGLAGTTIGTDLVAHSTPGGCTLLLETIVEYHENGARVL
jgi:hypothetical protein